ncbi:tyrosine integrase [Gordonia phage Goib]|uniref:Integrase n=2 Tax=Vendettavirus vendetta TaxID=2049886 RepID=A0A160DFH7_9CAUD|nr:integrase [Gordonia phage Vendetta]YP_009275391.1 integrase [Gordonia phage Splinter]ANA85584.1 tyrosine integrase [Gordonia phage Vendetta]ANA85663.1 tyrosine integrase [Gordonia phage Splinter]WNO25781.1 tyrosine integrase [Gordonia phage Goib]
MGWAEKLPSGKYRAVYRDSDGRQRPATPGITYVRKAQAERAASAAEERERDNPSPAGADRVTWGEWEPRWLEGRKRADSTERSDAARIRDHVRPYWHDRPLRAITRTDVETWTVKLSQELAPSTVHKCYFLLSASLKAAVGARLIVANPCKGVTLPKIPPQPDRYLEDAEYKAIRVTLDDFDQFAADLLVGTGLRLGEALALHWEHVDLDHRAITVAWSYDPVARKMKPPKDHERRDVPIGSSLVASLRDRLDQAGPGTPPDVEYIGSATPPTRTGLVLAHVAGRPMDSSNFRHRWEASCRIAWTGPARNRRHVGKVRLHDLRHTYASRLLRAGVPIEEVSALLGHESIRTTMRYKHLAKSHWDTVRRALG